MIKHTLIIIDMQSEFGSSSNRKLNKSIKLQIMKAMENNLPIVFVEYYGSGKTRGSLTRITRLYDKKYRVLKSEDDGSRELQKLYNKDKSIFHKKLVICGVNTNCCVYRTVSGLVLSKIPINQIEIPVNCCNTDYVMSIHGEHAYHSSLESLSKSKYNPFYGLINIKGVKLV